MNSMCLVFDAKTENESFARTSGIAFLLSYNLSQEMIMEIKTVLAEGIVNAMLHGYQNSQKGKIRLQMSVDEQEMLTIVIEDEGVGIQDVCLARTPMYTTRQDLERSGMGFTIMECFLDDLTVESEVGKGCRITGKKSLKSYG